MDTFIAETHRTARRAGRPGGRVRDPEDRRRTEAVRAFDDVQPEGDMSAIARTSSRSWRHPSLGALELRRCVSPMSPPLTGCTGVPLQRAEAAVGAMACATA